jgi:DNA-binding transcriptional MerR regulator
MEKGKPTYTVHQLAELAGVSVRTLHHYDQLGLLAPAARTAAGYRLYREPDLLRLQQILFFKELDFPLAQIKEILDQPGFDQLQALRDHRRRLQARGEQIAQLVRTIDKTILKITEADMELTDAELYEGFSQEQIERYQREAREMYDPKLVEESNRRVRKMSKAQWNAIKQEGDQVTRGLAELSERLPGDPEVQQLIARHHAWIENFYPCSSEIYRGLGQLYVEHPEFRANYDRYRPGLADFMQAAMNYYCDHTLDH